MTKWPEPAAHLIERHAFHVSPHGQDAEGHDWLEVDEEVSQEAFPVYTADQVRSIVRAEMEECANLAESQFSNVAEKLYGQELAALIREKIKENANADRWPDPRGLAPAVP